MNEQALIGADQIEQVREIPAITDRISLLHDIAVKGRDICMNHADILLGGEPESDRPSEGCGRSVCGEVGALHEVVDRLEAMLRQMVEQAERFHSL